MPKKSDYVNPCLQAFIEECKKMKAPRVLELSTKRVVLNRERKHTEWIPHASEHLGFDRELGIDVDIIGDIYGLSKKVGIESFDVIISCATIESYKYPHLAAYEIMKTLTINGLLFVQTHQSYILKSPPDYFRFTREGLISLFGTKNGFLVVDANYEFPARIVSERVPEISSMDAYLNTTMWGKKTKKTPHKYIYEYS
jgi:hypothetical protein